MDREELGDRTERHEWADAEHGEGRFQQDDAVGRYDGGVLEELEAHQFFHPQSVRWYRSLFSEHNPDEGRDLGDVEFLHDRGWVVECGDRLGPTWAAVLVFGRPRYVRQALPRPVVDCQFIGAAYDEGPFERHWTDRIVVKENLLQAWLTVAERYMRHAERPFRLDPRTMLRNSRPASEGGAQSVDRGSVPRNRPRKAGGHRDPGHLPRLAESRPRPSRDPQRRGPKRVRADAA